MRSRSRALAGKSVDAMLAAIEVYNKPDFAYREECFAILAVNSWELLLKARLLQLSGNRIGAVLVYERRRKADGQLSDKRYRQKGRSGTHLSVGMFRAVDLLRDEYGDVLPAAVRENLELMCEIRDNAVHFLNKGFDLSKAVQQLGTACVRNYLGLAQSWFGIDLARYNFFLMPLAFVGAGHTADAVTVNAEERKVLAFLRERIAENSGGDGDDYSVALRLDLKFMRSKSGDATPVVVSNDPDATLVTLSEEDIRDRYPWDYAILTTRLRKRYSDFKANQRYHEIRKLLELDERYCKKRFLDPATKAGTGKCFYNPNIVKQFDLHYVRTP